jgi:hypothetical protein
MKPRSQLRYFGQWPDGLAPTNHQAELTVAARRLAEAALEDLGRFGVVVTLDEAGRARFRATKVLPPAAKLAIERHADLIEAYLRERSQRDITEDGLEALTRPRHPPGADRAVPAEACRWRRGVEREMRART